MSEEIKELYYLGFYTKVVNDAANAKKDEDTEFMVMRSRLALNQIDFVINATKQLATPVHKGINLLAKSMKAKSTEAIEELLQGVDETMQRTSPLYAVCIGIVNLRMNKISEALEVLNGVNHPEAAAVRIQALLSINRPDLATAELDNIPQPVQQKICRIFIALCKDKETVRQASLDLQDLADGFARYGDSALISNAMAICHFVAGEWESAAAATEVATEKFPNDETVSINRAVALAHTTEYEKLKTQVEMIHSFEKNSYKAKIDEMLRDFDETAARLQSTKE